MFGHIAALGIVVAILSVSLPAKSQACTLLALVGGEGSEVEKTIYIPTIPGLFGVRITRNNWNTDWIVPPAQQFKSFAATIVSQEGGVFDIRMYLKYSDETEDKFYDVSNSRLNAGEPLELRAIPRHNEQPYQVN